MGMLFAVVEGAIDGKELFHAFFTVGTEEAGDSIRPFGFFGYYLLQDAAAEGIVDGAAVVGIYETGLPEFGALVNIGDTGSSQFDQQQGQTIPVRLSDDSDGKWDKVMQEERILF